MVPGPVCEGTGRQLLIRRGSSTILTMMSLCDECDNETPRGITICVGCCNESTGLCRWCGQRPAASASSLCEPCDDAGDIAAEVGTFSGAMAVWRYVKRWSNYLMAVTPISDRDAEAEGTGADYDFRFSF